MMKKNQQIQKKISEGLEFEDLKGLINDNVMIDLHKPKIGDVEDTVVVAFEVTYEEPAKDLSQFIETGALDHLDVEVSSSPDQDGTWKVFVEFLRDHDLFEKIQNMLKGVDQISSRDSNNWTYRAFNVDGKKKFSKENFDHDVVNSRYEYRKKYLRKNKKESVPGELEENWARKIRKYQSR
jgi:hypothetical protein